MKNQSIGRETHWAQDGLTYTEVVLQEYSDCAFSAGNVEGHAVDTMYLRLERPADPEREIFVLLRPDEAAALAWCLNGALWSQLIEQVPNG